MKPSNLIAVAILLVLAAGTGSPAQMGMDFFKRPAIASLFKPVVGGGAVYQTTGNEPAATKEAMEITVVGKDVAEGKEAVWIEIAHAMKGVDGYVYNKALITKDDFRIVKTVMQIPGRPAMEMPLNSSAKTQQRMTDDLNQWTQVGVETVAVPAGIFSCQHWKKSGGSGEIWASDKISPFGMVKEINGNSTQVLVKVITDAKDHITGPVTPFDPQLFRQMIMEQAGKQRP
jgi:hypothetical protein